MPGSSGCLTVLVSALMALTHDVLWHTPELRPYAFSGGTLIDTRLRALRVRKVERRRVAA